MHICEILVDYFQVALASPINMPRLLLGLVYHGPIDQDDNRYFQIIFLSSEVKLVKILNYSP